MYGNSDIESLFNSCNFYVDTVACHSFVFLLEFIYAHNREICNKLSFPKMEYNSSHLYLANHSFKQLNIISDNKHQGKYSSIIQFMDNCVTIMGTRKLRENILHPITDSNILNDRYNRIDFFINNSNHLNYIRDSFKNIYDIEKASRKIMMSKSTIQDIIQFYDACRVIKTIFDYCNNNNDILTTLTFPFKESGEKVEKIINCIEEQFNIHYINHTDTKDVCETENVMNQHHVSRNLYEELDIIEKKYTDSNKKILSLRNFFSQTIFSATPSKKKN